MKRYLCFLAALATALSLVGCTLPGEQAEDDEFIPDTSYSDSVEVTDTATNYHWSLEPTVSADNIIVFDASQINPDGDVNSMYENVAVIYSSGLYGFIDYKGEILVEPAYKYYYICSCGQIILYNITDEISGSREYCTIDSQGEIVNYFPDHESSRIEYYYDDGKIYYAREAEDWQVREYTDKKTVVAVEAKVDSLGNGEYDAIVDDGSKYGLVKQGKVVLDFEYDDYYAPAYKGAGITAIALEKDGKWGYVNSSGDEIISFNCDEVFSSYNGEFSDSEESGHPYLFSDDIVAVSINYSFGYYDIDGNCLVRSTEFEQARPVHRGRAWVCTGGLWGVIGFGDEDDEEEVTTTTTTTTTTTAAASTWATTQSSSTAETTASSETTEAYTEPQTDTEPVETQPAETQPPATTTQAYVEPEPTPEPTVPNDQEY